MTTVYENRPETLFIGDMTHYPVSLHMHEEAEILAVTAGEVRLVIDEVPCRLSPGDLAVIFPLTPHSYEEISPEARGIVAIFPPDVIPEYNGTFRSLSPEQPVIRADLPGPDTHMAVSRLEEMNMERDLPLCIAFLHVLLADTLNRLSYQPVYDYSERGLGHRIMHYVSEHACEDITLESTAHAMGISPSHLSHFFAEKLHIPFRSYINASRITRARLLMRNPALTLTEISGLCGYSNMRTFRRAFFKEVGCLPSEHIIALRNRVSVMP